MVFQRALLTAFVLTCLLISPAHSNTPDDFLRSTGKIYVVVGALALIFLLIVGYLIYLDRNIRTLENQSTNDENQ